MSDWAPDTLWWVLTARCNLRCDHCYLDPGQGSRPELSEDEALAVLRGAAERGISRLVVTGGEPFLRSDLVRLISSATDLGISLERIETNGTRLWSAAVEAVLSHQAEFAVSLDGIRAHDQLRGVKGLHQRVSRAIEDLVDCGARVVVQTVLAPDTLEELAELQRQLTGFGLHGWRLFAPVHLGAWSRRDGISPQHELRAYQGVLERWLRDGRPFELWLGSLLTQRRSDGAPLGVPAHVCGHASDTVTLMPDGRVSPCCRLAEQAPRNEEASLVTDIGWAACLSGLRPVKRRAFEILLDHEANGDCPSCALRAVCELGCRAQAVLEGRGPLGSSHRQCWLMRNGYRGEMRRWDVRGNALRRP